MLCSITYFSKQFIFEKNFSCKFVQRFPSCSFNPYVKTVISWMLYSYAFSVLRVNRMLQIIVLFFNTNSPHSSAVVVTNNAFLKLWNDLKLLSRRRNRNLLCSCFKLFQCMLQKYKLHVSSYKTSLQQHQQLIASL